MLAYAASGLPGSNRVKNVVYENQVASGTYKKSWWKFRGSKYGHEHHVHISFTAAADTDGSVWPLPSLAMTLAQEKSWRSKLGGVK